MMRDSTPNAASALSWEWDPKNSSPKTGICLSGGGLRAASYSLGALQAMQEERRLLFGEASAEFLAAVSGGSYIAATLAVGASALKDDGVPPLEHGAPETAHVVTSGRYLLTGGRIRTGLLFITLLLLNVLSLFGLFAWAGFMLADAAWIVDQLDLPGSSPPHGIAAQWLGALICLLAVAIILRSLTKDGGWRRSGSVVLLPILAFTAPSFVARAVGSEIFTLGWWRISYLPLVALLLIVVALASLFVLRPFTDRLGEWLARGLGAAAATVPRLVGLWILGVACRWMFLRIDPALASDATPEQTASAGLILALTLIGGVLAGSLPQRVSLHREYRRRLARCFAVARGNGGSVRLVPDVRLSQLGTELRRSPQLLICATANVRWRDGTGRRRSFAPFVFASDRCGIPGVQDASFPTERLEFASTPGLFPLSREPIVSLMSACASAGAALSPSMGRMTLPALRPFIAALNVRTGAWIPNPMSTRARARVGQLTTLGPVFRDQGLGLGFDELVPEMVGASSPWDRKIYVTDGGHYDNLGLTTLLRAHCQEIWCIDAEPDKQGRHRQLDQVLDLALQELGVLVDVDLGVFEHARPGEVRSTHALGKITYPDGFIGRLVVIKLGVSSAASESIQEYRQSDHPFPYHPTWVQWYGSERFDAYRQLGYDSTQEALRETL